MLESAVGEDVFSKAIKKYLLKFKFSNAVTKNLLDEIQELYKEIDISQCMDTWTLQSGFPIVTVKKKSEGEYTLTQKRFLKDPSVEHKSEPSPLKYILRSHTFFNFLNLLSPF